MTVRVWRVVRSLELEQELVFGFYPKLLGSDLAGQHFECFSKCGGSSGVLTPEDRVSKLSASGVRRMEFTYPGDRTAGML